MVPVRLVARFAIVTALVVACGTVAKAAFGAAAPPAGHVGMAADPSPPVTPSPGPPSPSPSPPGSPSPSPAGPGNPLPSPGSPGGSGGCDLWDVGCKARGAINGWFKSLVKSAVSAVFDDLAAPLLLTPRVDEMPQIRQLWSGSAVTANTCLLLIVTIAGITLMAHQTVQTSYTVKEVAPRLVTGVVLANTSLMLSGKAIEFANALSYALLGGKQPSEVSESVAEAVKDASTRPDLSIFLILLALVAAILAQVLLLIYFVRLMLVMLLLAAAPLALMCHCLPQTEYLAKLWWRSLAGVLAIQVAQSLVLITATRTVLTEDFANTIGFRGGDLMQLSLVICLLYILVRIPAWIARMVWQGGLRRSPIARAARVAAAIAFFRALGAGRARRPHIQAAPRTGLEPVPQPEPFLQPEPDPTYQQLELPTVFPQPTGVQTELFTVPETARTQPGRWTQPPMPAGRKPPGGPVQEEIPIRVRHEQLQLPIQTGPRHTQQPLFEATPEMHPRHPPPPPRPLHKGAEPPLEPPYVPPPRPAPWHTSTSRQRAGHRDRRDPHRSE